MTKGGFSVRAVPLLSRAGWAFVAFLFVVGAYLYVDRTTSKAEVVVGIVSNVYATTPRYGSSPVRCRIRLGNGFYIEDSCAAPVGARVNVCRRTRRLSGAVVYEVC